MGNFLYWYENIWFWVHEVKRLGFPFYIYSLIYNSVPPLVYQDHLHFCRSLTSFIPPSITRVSA